MIDVVTLRKLKEAIDMIGIYLSQDAVNKICIIIHNECNRLLDKIPEKYCDDCKYDIGNVFRVSSKCVDCVDCNLWEKFEDYEEQDSYNLAENIIDNLPDWKRDIYNSKYKKGCD